MKTLIKKTRKKIGMTLILFAFMLLISACSTTKINNTRTYYQANQIKKCPIILPVITNPIDGLREYRALYTDCALRHNNLINTIKNQEEIKHVQ